MASTILIAEPGWRRPRRLATNGVDRSWAVDTMGTLSAELMTRTLTAAGITRPKGMWLVVEDDDAGDWGGEVQDTQSQADGTTELTATDWRILFRHRRLPSYKRPFFGPAGALAQIAIMEAERLGQIGLRDRRSDENSLPVQLYMERQSLLDALDSLAAASGDEWWVLPYPLGWRWGRKGSDVSGTRQLVAPRHIIDFNLLDSIEPMVNDLLAYPTNERYTVSQTFTVEDAASIAEFGRRQGETALSQHTSANALRPAAQAIVNQLSQQGVAIEMQLTNVDRCFGWFREGDTISVLLPSVNVQAMVRIMARSLREPDYIMDVSGIVTAWRFG